ncbi:MAG: DedA family protein [Alphaproteobacteria bacterium]|nr:MAG: DedA family protein [Alphaproteobacteria bacterium]
MGSIGLYGSLWLSAFLSATLLPGTSEGLLGFYVVEGKGESILLLLAAVTGNVAGSLVNWAMGRFFLHFKDRRWFPIKPGQMKKAERIFAKYGEWTLLFAWLPIIGDPLTLVAGVLNVRFWRFLVWVTIGKTARYLIILQAALHLAN